MTGRLARGIRALVDRAEAFARDRRGRMALLREVDALAADQRALLLEESGMSYREFANAMKTPFISEDLNARALLAVGTDPAEFRSQHTEWSRHMQRLCMTCAARSRCRHDLDADVFGRQYRHYCANAESLSELVASEGRHAQPQPQPVQPAANA